GAALGEQPDLLVLQPDRVRAEEPWAERAKSGEVPYGRRPSRRPRVLVLGRDLGDVHLQGSPEPLRAPHARLDELVGAVEDRAEGVGEAEAPLGGAIPARSELVLRREGLVGRLAPRLRDTLRLVHRAPAEKSADARPLEPAGRPGDVLSAWIGDRRHPVPDLLE